MTFVPEAEAKSYALLGPDTVAYGRMLPLVTVVAVGATVNLIWLAPAALSAVLLPTKLTVAPTLRGKLAKVRVAFCPVPLVELTVEAPLTNASAPNVSEEAVPLLPRKLSVPPLSAIPARSAMRLVLLPA